MTDAPWQDAWQPLIAEIGKEFGSADTLWGADTVEAGAIRRYLEPLEFDCPLHDDADFARQQGYDQIIAPYTAIPSLAVPPYWVPGQQLFTHAGRDSQPQIQSLQPPLPAAAPPFSGYFATDVEFDFLRPVEIGERLGKRGRRLLDCQPKQTQVGRGAFCTIESDFVSDRGDIVARMRVSLFCYNPHTSRAEESQHEH